MVKMIRKILAMITALSVCVSVLATTALAAEPVDASEPLTVTVTITEADGSTTTSTKTETVTTSSDSTDGVNTETTRTDSTWESTNVKTDSQTVQEGQTTTTVDTSVTTEIKGEQTVIDSVTEDTNTGVESHSGSTSGQESTDVTDETTVTEVAQDVEFSSDTTDQTLPEQTQWVDKETTEGTWTSGTLETGEPTVTETVPAGKEEIAYTPPAEGVTLTMSQTDQTTTVQKIVSAKDVENGTITLPTAGTTTEEIKDENGVVIGYKITTITVEKAGNGYQVTTTVAETGEPVSESTTVTSEYSESQQVPTAPPGYSAGETTKTETDGYKTVTTTQTVTEITDDDGNVIGYRIETKKETTAPSTLASQETTSKQPVTYILPEKPEASVTTDKDGYTTAITVEEILEGGEVVGYQSTLVKTDPSGKEVYREQERIYRTVQTQTETETMDPDKRITTETTVKTVMGTAVRDVERTTAQTYTWSTTVTTTEEVYQQLTEKGELYVLYQGQLFAVAAGEKHGTVRMTSIQPDSSLMPEAKKVDTEKDLYHRVNSDEMDEANAFDGFDFQWLGEYGLESAIRVKAGGADTYQAHQFVLVDKEGKKHYVYCADLITSPEEGYRYNMENVFDADYYDSDAAAQIQAIVVNGYWGTVSGIGSLDAVKNMLKAAQAAGTFPKEINIDALTDGEALTATQAAIWVYGNSNTEKEQINKNPDGTYDPVGRYYTGSTWTGVSADSKERIEALFNYLLKTPAPDTDQTTPLITEKTFASDASITVKGKATDTDGNVLTDDAGNEKFNTDISFSLEIERSKLTGNLIVQVLDQNGKVLAKKNLVTDDSNIVGQLIGDAIEYTDGNYIIRDLQIAENTKITLSLSGTQNLGLGAYLYSAEISNGKSSQTFVGLSSGERDVDLSVQLQFSVTDPTLTTSQTTAKRTDTRTDSKTDTIRQVLVSTEGTAKTKTDVYGTVTLVTTEKKQTHSERNWSSSYYYDLTDWEDTSESGITIAEAAKTGDLSMMWVLLSVLSLGGFLLLSRKRSNEV